MNVQRLQVVGGSVPSVSTLVDNLLKESTGITQYQTANHYLNGQLTSPSNLAAFGRFTNGNVAAGTQPLPSLNQPQSGPTLFYAGGIGYSQGICLSTGFVDDSDPAILTTSGLGKGVQGPNNGQPLAVGNGNEDFGEADYRLFPSGTAVVVDNDVSAVLPGTGFDNSVIHFRATFSSPGIVMLRYSHCSDELPNFPSQFGVNDAPVAILKNDIAAGATYKNLLAFRVLDNQGNYTEMPVALYKLEACGFLGKNQVAPAPNPPLITQSQLQTNGANKYYDVEYAAISKKMRCELPKALPPTRYRIKIAIADVGDEYVDSATFFPDDGLALFPFQQGDFNRDGYVDLADYTIWQDYSGMSNPDITFEEGDANGDLTVNSADYSIWASNYGLSGNIDSCADFNRSGWVDEVDGDIWWTWWEKGLSECASRFEGDANEDGIINWCDYDIWEYEYLTETPLRPCACQSENGARAAEQRSEGSCIDLMTKAQLIALKEGKRLEHRVLIASAEATRARLPSTPDANSDGKVNDQDREIIVAIITEEIEAATKKVLSDAAAPSPTPAPVESASVETEVAQ